MPWPDAQDGRPARDLLRPGRPAAHERLEFPATRPERSVGLRVVSPHRRHRGRTDRDPLHGRRHVQPHARPVLPQQRLRLQRVPVTRKLAVVRPGQRSGRSAGLRRAARRPQRSQRCRLELVERFSAGPAPGRLVPWRPQSGPRPVACGADRCRRGACRADVSEKGQRTPPGCSGGEAALAARVHSYEAGREDAERRAARGGPIR